MHRSRVSLFGLVILLIVARTPAQAQIDLDKLSGMQARAIGPAGSHGASRLREIRRFSILGSETGTIRPGQQNYICKEGWHSEQLVVKIHLYGNAPGASNALGVGLGLHV